VKLTNSTFYWDYNATSPLASSVQSWLSGGDVPFGNPSSIHSLGIKSKQLILETADFLLEHFSVKKDYDVFFHSGASESINTFIKSAMAEDECCEYHGFYSDHSTGYELTKYFEKQNRKVHLYKPEKNGDFPLDTVLDKLKSPGKHVLNFTWVNSETGVIWPLSFISKLKKVNENIYVHVDGVQAPGKTLDYRLLNSSADSYTFSGHKFGSLKGVGFSFIKKNSYFAPFVLGGGQQKGYRSGTENVMGIYSLKLALEELCSNVNLDALKEGRDYFERFMLEEFSGHTEIVGSDASFRNLATSLVKFQGVSLGVFLTALDMAGIFISSGSACSSGSLKPSRVLLSMGFDEKSSSQCVRFSFGGQTNQDQIDQGLKKMTPIIHRFLQK
jgi:cysteine desulfurase